MTRLFLIADIAGTTVAISSDVIESVVKVDEVVPVPKCDPILVGLFALRSRVLTLVDCQYRISGKRHLVEQKCLAVVATIGGHSFGLLVDKVRDVVSVSEDKLLPVAQVDNKWRDIVCNLVEFEDKLLMVVDPGKLVTIAEPIAA